VVFGAVGGNVLVIECGITTVDGIVICVITDVGTLDNSVTGTKTIVDGIHSVG